MQVRRCSHLFVELDEQPRFDFTTLLAGGDGLDRTPRFLAFAAHLDNPVPVNAEQLALLQKLTSVTSSDWHALCTAHDVAALQGLLDIGLLIGEHDEHAALRERDAAL